MTPKRRFVAGLSLLTSILIGVGDAVADVSVEPYVGLQGGVFLWPAYSNRDEVEADTGPGFAWAIVGGLDLASDRGEVLTYSPPSRRVERLSGRLELEVASASQAFTGSTMAPSSRPGTERRFARPASTSISGRR